jgi:hypothetical protein
MKSKSLLVTVDSLHSDSVGFVGGSKSSLFLDSLASRDMVFRNAFVTGGGTRFAMSPQDQAFQPDQRSNGNPESGRARNTNLSILHAAR